MAKIYISSTYKDLKDHREAVSHALRKMRYDVIGMEDYAAADQRPLDRCRNDVGTCDVYDGIFAWRYGFIPRKGNVDHKSITELEYRHARRLTRPCLIFILDETVTWLPHWMDGITGEGQGGKCINKLKSVLEREHSIERFKSPDDLANKVTIAIHLSLEQSYIMAKVSNI